LHLREERGELALRVGEEARDLAKELAEPVREAEAMRCIVGAQLLGEKVTEARELAISEMKRWAENCNVGAEAVMRLAFADVFSSQSLGQPREAQKQAQTALECFKALGYKRGQAAALEVVSSALLGLGSMSKALKTADEALKLYEELGNGGKKAILLRILGKAHSGRQQFQEAESKLTKSCELCQELGERPGQAASLLALAAMRIASSPSSELVAALDIVEKALTICHSLADEMCDDNDKAATRMMDRQAVAAWGLTVRIFERMRDFEGAMNAAKDMLRVARELADVDLIDSAMDTYAELYIEKDEEKKLDFMLRAETRMAREKGEVKREALALQREANRKLLVNPDQALQQARQARELLRRAEDRKGEAQALAFEAGILAQKGDFREALKVFDGAAELQRELLDPSGEAQVLRTVKEVCEQKGQKAEALKWALMRTEVFRTAKYQDDEAESLLMVAELMSKDKSQGTTPALKEVIRAQKLFQELGDKEGEARALILAAEFHSLEKQQAKALRACRAARQLAEEAHEKGVEADALLAEARVQFKPCQAAIDTKGRPDKEALKKVTETLAEAQKRYESMDDFEGLADVTEVLSFVVDCNFALALTPEARETSLEMVRLYELLGNVQAQAASLLDATQAYLYDPPRLMEAQRLAQQAISLAHEVEDADTEAKASELIRYVEALSKQKLVR